MPHLAIAITDIQTERFSVKAGEPLPAKYQYPHVWESLQRKFGKPVVEELHGWNRDELAKRVLDRRIQALNQENRLSQAAISELAARCNELEAELAKAKRKT